MANNNLSAFSFQMQEVRVHLDEKGEPWWVARDVCEVLGIKAPEKAFARIDQDWKQLELAKTRGGPQRLLFVSEPGLYELVFCSRKPIAKAFRRWVFEVAVPQIRERSTCAEREQWASRMEADIARFKEASEIEVESAFQQRLKRVFKEGEHCPSAFPLAASSDSFDFTGFGVPDLVTDEFIFEVKRFKSWKHALGQILAYTYDPKGVINGRTGALYLFDVPVLSDLDRIGPVVHEHGLEVFYSLKETPKVIARWELDARSIKQLLLGTDVS